jgi:phosphate transport system substrate-binding protein
MMLVAGSALAADIEIKGSTTVLPIMQKVVEAYMADNPGVSISVSGGGSGNGVKAIIDGTTDIGMASRDMKDKEVKLAKSKGVTPKRHTVALDAIVPVVNNKNPLNKITTDQLQDIYAGKTRNWSKLTSWDKPVAVVSRDTSSGTYETWEKLVMGDERVFPAAMLQASNGAVVQVVSKNEYAIGYIGIGYLDNSVKGLPVNGVMASAETAKSGEYPIARDLYIFTQGEPKGETAKLIDYILSPKGQKFVKEVGYVPVN